MIGKYSNLSNIINFKELCASIAGKFHDEVIPKSISEGIKSVDNPAIGEIAGPDSIAAIIKAVGEEDFDGILPVVALTGTEYGSFGFIERNLEVLRDRIKEINGGIVFKNLLLYDPDFWRALNGRFIQIIINKYGFYSPCLGCHLYVHAMRIPVALALGIRNVITGERESHDGRVKINQLPVALDSYIKLMSRWDINLILPLRYVDDSEEIIRLTNGLCKKIGQFNCIFKGNYCDLHGDVIVDSKSVADFYVEFGVPATIELIEKLLKDSNTDLEKILKDYLK